MDKKIGVRKKALGQEAEEAPYTLKVFTENFKLGRPFAIARGTKTDVDMVVAEIHDRTTGVMLGRGEARPYARYDETPESLISDIELQRETIEKGIMPPDLKGAASNAVDCALLDLKCKLYGSNIGEMLGIKNFPESIVTGNTVSIGTSKEMAAQAKELLESGATILKIKLGSNADGANLTRLESIKEAVEAFKKQNAAFAGKVEVSVDFNEGCVKQQNGVEVPDIAHCNDVLAFAAANHIKYIEQPFPERYDAEQLVKSLDKHGVPILADESCHTAASLKHILQDSGYDGVNIKLGKTGGLKNAMAMVDTLQHDYPNALIGIGSMLSTSLSSAADYALVAYAKSKNANVVFVDIDSPTLVGAQFDRKPSMVMNGSLLYAPAEELWGAAAVNMGREHNEETETLARTLRNADGDMQESKRAELLSRELKKISGSHAARSEPKNSAVRGG